MNTNIPQELDWVAKRAKCTPASMFSKLLLQVREDVAVRESLKSELENKYRVAYKLHDGANLFLVERSTFSDVQDRVTFTLHKQGIRVERLEGEPLEATLTLSNDGECRLLVRDVEHNLWQFSKLALEGILFDAEWSA